jgi:Mn-dependent DtxR family transcriptional regulator
MSKTQDERFVIRLYEAASQAGDIQTPMNRYDIGKLCSLHPTAVNTICKLLIQANFIKKVGEVDIKLTPHGEKLAQRLLVEK